MTNVFHPTALNEASQTAFYHALKLTLATRGKLNILHITEGGEDVSFNHFPGIRDTLVKWSLIEAGSEKSIVSTLGIDARKVIGTKGDPVGASVNYLDKHPAEFVVLATSQNQGLASLFSGSADEHAVDLVVMPTQGRHGFLDALRGSTTEQVMRELQCPLLAVPCSTT